jgi:hypothetical protein
MLYVVEEASSCWRRCATSDRCLGLSSSDMCLGVCWCVLVCVGSTGKLMLDAMGNFSPVMRQARGYIHTHTHTAAGT